MKKQKIKKKVLEKLGNYEKYLNHSSKVREVIDLTIQQTAKEIFDDIEKDILVEIRDNPNLKFKTLTRIYEKLKKKWIK